MKSYQWIRCANIEELKRNLCSLVNSKNDKQKRDLLDAGVLQRPAESKAGQSVFPFPQIYYSAQSKAF